MPSEKAKPTYVRVVRSFIGDSRRRAGLNFGRKPIAIELTPDQLEAITADSQLDILNQKQFDEEVTKFDSVEKSTPVASTKKQGVINKAKGNKKAKSEGGIEVQQGVRGSSAIARAANAKAGK